MPALAPVGVLTLWCVPQVWEGDGVVASARKLIGATNPLAAEPGTIRGDFAIQVRKLEHFADSGLKARTGDGCNACTWHSFGLVHLVALMARLRVAFFTRRRKLTYGMLLQLFYLIIVTNFFPLLAIL